MLQLHGQNVPAACQDNGAPFFPGVGRARLQLPPPLFHQLPLFFGGTLQVAVMQKLVGAHVNTSR
ncbi:hypothetical protein COU36_00505 [Candidatus Micrarchaeota archaeon CG10_big_fil_rev_8_21_14_0_10_59_7]|nr:MAG: hypothetical protein COU36_00505 [Candidatus Micrarchaeota archaeon CG10_big_fil_rev_8_21_14_0_10_59_7]